MTSTRMCSSKQAIERSYSCLKNGREISTKTSASPKLATSAAAASAAIALIFVECGIRCV